MTRRAGLAAVLLALVVGALSACTSLPASGPVVDVPGSPTGDDKAANGFNAVAPRPGMTASQVVDGFLEAMAASPVQVEVAAQYLTTTAAAVWDWQAGTTTYADRQRPRERGLDVEVDLVDAEHYARSGAYLGRLPAPRQALQLDLTLEQGEYRITDPPPGLVVPRLWFTQRYRAAAVYYFDPSGRILVPQPVFVPRGEGLAAELVSRLLAGPGPELGGVVRSYLPAGLDAGLSVVVGPDGVADVPLGDQPGVLSAAVRERLLAQLAWTLRQQPGIEALRVTLGGAPVRGPDNDVIYAVDEADGYDPNGQTPSTALYAVRDGRLTERDGNELRPVPGPFGSGRVPVSSATVNIAGTRAAGVGVSGRGLRIAPTVTGSAPGAAEAAPLVVTGTSLLPPEWDFADRVWVVDRTGSGAVVSVVVGGRASVVRVPGVTGEDVSSFVVSHDGSRVLFVVHGPRRDEVRVGRVVIDPQGTRVRVVGTRALDLDPDQPIRFADITWTSPTTIALLTPLDETRQIYEVRVVGVDGAPSAEESGQTPLTGAVTGLAGTPVLGAPTYAVTADGIIDLTDGSAYGFTGAPATSISYAG